jgi:phosphoribosyl 1,2-cyclic phosphodiesterase
MEIKTLASGSDGNAYWVSDGRTRLLIEAGIPIRDIQRGCGYTVTDLAGCLISHSHGDHSKAAKDLISKGVDVYASKGTLDALKLSGHRAHRLGGDISGAMIGTFFVTCFDTVHDAPEPLGFVVTSKATGERLLFFIDTGYIKYNGFADITHLMCECNHDTESIKAAIERGDLPPEMLPRLMKNHMSLDTLIKFLRANNWSKLRQVYLLHLSDRNSGAERMRAAVQKETGVEVYIC